MSCAYLYGFFLSSAWYNGHPYKLKIKSAQDIRNAHFTHLPTGYTCIPAVITCSICHSYGLFSAGGNMSWLPILLTLLCDVFDFFRLYVLCRINLICYFAICPQVPHIVNYFRMVLSGTHKSDRPNSLL